MPQMSLKEIEEDLDIVGPAGISNESIKPPGPAKVSYTHDKMIDYIIGQPRITQRELSAIFGYTEGWVSQIMSSDAFRERLALRREEVTDPAIKAAMDIWFPSTQESLQYVMDKSLEIIKEKLQQPKVPDSIALKALELGAKGLGIGGFGRALPDPDEKKAGDSLEKLANRLEGLLPHQHGEILDGEIIQEGSSGQGLRPAMPANTSQPHAPALSASDGEVA